MSAAPSFKIVFFVSPEGVRLWKQEKKTWIEDSEKISLDKDPTEAIQAQVQGANVLVLVSDSAAGHLQFTAENKKEELTDEAIGQRLQDDFGVDIEAYEFAMQRFPITRNKVQMSVSGIEANLFESIRSWVLKLSPRKLWITPFSWFLVPLKSVEPVLIAVASGKNTVSISHHYLGVDDARELPVEDIAEYVESRKEERKETHLLYLHAPARIAKKIESSIEDIVAVHPLLPDSESDDFAAVIQSVIEKGTDSLGEILHFEEVGESPLELPQAESVSAVAPVFSDSEEETEDDQVNEDTGTSEQSSETNDFSEDSLDLPAPVPPVLTAPQPPVMTSEVVESSVSVSVLEDQDQDEIEELDTEEIQKSSQPVKKVVIREEVKEVLFEEPDLEVETEFTSESPEEAEIEKEEQESQEEQDVFAALAASKASKRVESSANHNSKDRRYRDVAPKRSWGMVFLVFFAVVGLTVLAGGAVFWSQQVQPPQQAFIPGDTAPTPTPTPAPTPQPEPAGMTVADKKQIDMVVLNATSRAGLAGRYQRALNAAGWNVTSTTNASASYSQTGVYIFTADDRVFETLSAELQDVTVHRLSANEETSFKGDVLIVVNQAVEPKVVPIDTQANSSDSSGDRDPEASDSASVSE